MLDYQLRLAKLRKYVIFALSKHEESILNLVRFWLTLFIKFEPRLSSVKEVSGDLRAHSYLLYVDRQSTTDNNRSETILFRIHRLIYIQLFI